MKGTILQTRLKYVRATAPELVEAVLQPFAESEQRLMSAMLLPSSWYPVDLLRRLEARIAVTLNRSPEELYDALGRFAALSNLTGTGNQRAYVREGDPHFVLRHSPRIYASCFSDGDREYTRTGEWSATIRVRKDFAVAQPCECLITRGWLAEAIRVSGGRAVRVIEERCGFRRDPACEFACTWG